MNFLEFVFVLVTKKFVFYNKCCCLFFVLGICVCLCFDVGVGVFPFLRGDLFCRNFSVFVVVVESDLVCLYVCIISCMFYWWYGWCDNHYLRILRVELKERLIGVVKRYVVKGIVLICYEEDELEKVGLLLV